MNPQEQPYDDTVCYRCRVALPMVDPEPGTPQFNGFCSTTCEMNQILSDVGLGYFEL